ncbi:MAG: protein kinase, partial [Thermoanaerobaculia bacterium]
MIGTRLGPYEITAKLGEGGMGEVYRARDAKLGREVAIKVLPAHLAQDAEALDRFEREAKAVAALSHPNILAIFDFGREGETSYAAMELLEGETLRARLEAGALPARKALEIAALVATGLAAAHERGIVHRDLKPDNLFLTRDGQVKILDFGLARQVEPHDSKSQLLAAPTQAPGTAAGTVLGTVGYMSPEQVRGESADHRSDIFSLGVVLYEMLTGRRAFEHGSAVETMSAILKEEPPELELLAAKQSPALVRTLQHCLEKRSGERFQSARDLAFDLRSLASGGSSSSMSGRTPAAGGASSARRRLPFALAVAGALLALAAGFLLGRGATPKPAAGATALRPSFHQLTRLPGGESSPALSPDGSSVVFERAVGEQSDLYLQRTDGQNAIVLTADCDRDDIDPAFSPDGARIAYRSDCAGGGIFVMGATGENARRVSDFGFNPSWSPDGREVAVATERAKMPWNRPGKSELWAIEIDSGKKRLVTKADAMHPSWSPSGKRIAFWGLPTTTFARDLYTVTADGSQSTFDLAVRLTDDPDLDWNPVWSADGGYLFF